MKRLLPLLILLISINCSDRKQTEKIERNAFILDSGNPKEEIFDFKIDNKADFSTYKYISQKDTSKTVFANFTRENQIFFGPNEFEISKKKPLSFPKLSDKEFYFYNVKEAMDDGPGPLLFNQEYGLLAIYNIYGPVIIFLKDSDRASYNQVLEALLEE